jgi:hypothetical protein
MTHLLPMCESFLIKSRNYGETLAPPPAKRHMKEAHLGSDDLAFQPARLFFS